ncbi:MAG: ABC transporter ATP-binding protein [Candidatus Wallbacteria bacterium]|nr:ABC transporter ATP-binding protein [Candidatus Wallbacteria bacterium]
MPLLEAENVSKVFGGLTAVKDFTLSMEPGEMVGLIGPNGAGKTTVFNLLTGFIPPTTGKIVLNDKNVTGFKAYQVAQQGMVRTFQNIRMFSNLTVLDNLKTAQHFRTGYGIGAAVMRLPTYYSEEKRIHAECMQLLERLELDQVAGEIAGSLPYGYQKRLEIARALSVRPKLLLLDEPAAGLNPTETRELLGRLTNIRKEFKLAMLLIEHDMKFVMGICERILVLVYGETIAQGLPEEIRKNPQVLEAYLGTEG